MPSYQIICKIGCARFVALSEPASIPCVAFTRLQDLRVTLVWTDPAASTGSTSALIHDLDLVVIAQSTGTVYYPNGLDEADTVNNVEKVIITDTTELETYTIQVRVSRGRGWVGRWTGGLFAGRLGRGVGCSCVVCRKKQLFRSVCMSSLIVLCAVPALYQRKNDVLSRFLELAAPISRRRRSLSLSARQFDLTSRINPCPTTKTKLAQCR